MTVRECFRKTGSLLGSAGQALHEAEYIMKELFGKDRSWFFAHGEEPVSDETARKAFDAAKRRLLGEPLQYIFERADFCGLSLYVDGRVLIPRQDTEVLAEEAVKFASGRCAKGCAPAVLDLCTGSGALALALAPFSGTLTASDISVDALDVAGINFEKYDVQVELVLSDLFESLKGRIFDLIICNPPYISAKDLKGLDLEVKDFEPCLALDGGEDGMELIRRSIEALGEHLAEDGMAFFEIGNGQADAVCRMAGEEGFTAEPFTDLSGEPRFVKIGRNRNRPIWAD